MVADDVRTSIALFRYRVIAPLLDPSLEEAERRRIRQEILAREHPCPGLGGARRVSGRTLRRWLAAYRKGGFEALKPRPRSDAQNPRAIPPQIPCGSRSRCLSARSGRSSNSWCRTPRFR